MIRTQATRWTITALLTLVGGSALSADLPARPQRPATRIYVGAPPSPRTVQAEDPALISIPTTPLLPGATTLPGYYGRAFDYNYQGSYYGGENSTPDYFWRLPYACGIYGYC